MANLGPIKEMKWSATYAARNWTVSLQGQDGPLRITITGFLWGNADTGWAANYAGLGQLGDEQIRDNGRTLWSRDGQPSESAYEFQHVMEFGSHSLWGWMIGAEIVVGGTAGAAAGIETPVTAVTGAITGASSMIGVSDVVMSHFVNAPQPPPQPPPPARPTPPQKGDMLVANAERSYIVGKNQKMIESANQGSRRRQRAVLALIVGLSGLASGTWELAHGQGVYLLGLLGGAGMLALAWFNLRRPSA